MLTFIEMTLTPVGLEIYTEVTLTNCMHTSNMPTEVKESLV